jgi:hypothetical protein
VRAVQWRGEGEEGRATCSGRIGVNGEGLTESCSARCGEGSRTRNLGRKGAGSKVGREMELEVDVHGSYYRNS